MHNAEIDYGGLRMTKGWCVECGAVYDETPTSFICPKCRKNRASQNTKDRNLSELGHKARRKGGDLKNDR